MPRACTYARSEYNKAYHAKHRDKLVARSKVYYAANKERQANRNRKSRYGVSPEQVESILSEQNGTCAICFTPEPAGKGTWHVDHCHTSGRVRGLLCHHCNLGLGHFKDSPTALRSAAAYLEINQ